MDLKGYESVVWIHVAKCSEHSHDLVNTATKRRVPYNTEMFIDLMSQAEVCWVHAVLQTGTWLQLQSRISE
jgi:hypothetical protein